MGEEKETSEQTSAPHLIPQPNGRGALLSGGVPGHRGAGGRPPDELRRASRESYGALLAKLEEKLGAELSVSEITQALNVTGKYGLGEIKAIVAEELLRAVGEVAGEYVAAEEMEAFTAALIARLKECA